ncbi:ATP-binding protein [Nonomuraea sp. K274]|uniref:ATP-binding protein n=2 Tax=Nonomuraea cypriaca TaxID=1187855 RepID=A0A931A7M8_9ACTN|nr:ATP-binding protein [Nonomuraea cypriaca]
MTMATNPLPGTREDRASAQLPAGITLIGSELRSTNLERDVRDPNLNSPYVGARALDVLDRVANAVADLKRTRAWSFTGPYGSGKSTLSNLLDAFLGHDTDRQREARQAVEATSPGLAARMEHARDERAEEGFLGAVATARREPLAATVHRALATAVERRWGKRPPKAVAQALRVCAEREVPTTENLLDALTALCDTGHPVLLILDEFGKSLEYLAASGDSGSAENDVFLLQMLAEKGAGRSGLPLFIFTLQHLAFSDYAARSSLIQTKEWAKVQGRFEDITFTPNLGDAVHLLQRRLDQSAVAEAGQRLIRDQAEAAAQAWTEHGLDSVVHISPEMLAGLYPLHPLTAVTAPLLAFQIGQHDRSLVGFLTNDEPNTVRRTIDEASSSEPKRASTIRLPQLYDYFFASGRTTILASSNASRWLEVDNRLNEAHGLPSEDRDILKTIGILNLIDVDGVLRATPAMIQFAMNDPSSAADPERFEMLQQRLHHLVETGFLTHRTYSNEYRVWQGTNIDIDARVKDIAVHVAPSHVVDHLGEHLGTVLPREVVAGAHMQRTGMMRYFRTAISLQADKLDGPGVVSDAADGMIIFHLGEPGTRPLVNSPLPVLIGTTKDPAAILDAGVTLRALEDLRHQDDIDLVAGREIEERIAEISHELGTRLDEAFNPQGDESSWYLWQSGQDTRSEQRESIEARSYGALVSAACDRVYPQTPHIRNEMAGRHELTSNGARARRVLLSDLVTNTGLAVLGYDTTKYSQERAMYHGVLEYLGLHRAAKEVGQAIQDQTIATHGVSRPDPKKHPEVIPTWERLEQALIDAAQPTPIVDIYEKLMAPPFGVKAGVVPILMVAALILRSSDVALFEEGNYCPRLNPEIIERLLADTGPDRFTVKAVPIGEGQRSLVVERLAAALNVDAPRSRMARNPALLSVTRAMLERVMVLTPYALHTKRLTPEALKVRQVLSEATDPDQLVFTALPQALALNAIPTHATKDEQAAEAYVTRVTNALDAISGASTALRRDVVAAIGQAFGIPGDLTQLRAGLAEALSGFASASLELDLQGFVSRILNTSLPNEDWLDPIIIRLTNKALGDWTDQDVDSFYPRVKEMARRLDRVGHLYQVQEVPAPQTRAPEPKQINTHLLTLTTPQGTEVRTLIHVPKQARDIAKNLVVGVIRQAEQELGPGGARILLAALAERLTATDSDHDPQEEEKL